MQLLLTSFHIKYDMTVIYPNMDCFSLSSLIDCRHYSDAMHAAEKQLIEFDSDYLRMERDLMQFHVKVAATESLRSIIARACHTQDPHCTQPQHNYRTHLLRLEKSLDDLDNQISSTETALRDMRFDRKDFLMDKINASQDEIRRHNGHSIAEIARMLRKSGYSKVLAIAHARVPVIKCHEDKSNLDIDLVINKKVGGHNSDLIRDLVNSDSTGKIKNVARILKSFIKSYDLGDASNGALSSYSWMVLLMHFFQNNEYLAPILSAPPLNTNNNRKILFSEDFYVGHTVQSPLPVYYQDRLKAVSVGELLILFTAYVTTRVDVKNTTLSLRGQGSAISRSVWSTGNMVGRSKYWCISIEVTTSTST